MKSPLKILTSLLLSLTSLHNVYGFHLPHLPPDCAINLVKSSTAILPQFDSIGHHVLHANQVLINKLLESNIDPAFKKTMILKVIDLTRQGDEMGGKILEDYYNFINYLL
jgi:hypothetical protein